MANRKNTFLIKRSNTPGKIPTAGDLLLGELALNTADVILYASGTTANTILPIGWDRVARTGDTMTGPLYGPSISATTISATTFYGNGNITVTGTASISTVSATTYYNLPIDVTVTGGTPNNSNRTYVFTNNTGGTFTVNCLTDITITGGTYDSINGIVSFVNNSGGTFSVTGFTTGSTFSGTTNYYSRFTSGGTISNGMIWDDGISGVNFMGTDNTAINIISPVGYYYPSLNFYNNGGTPTGSITGYGSELNINGGLKVHPNYINLPYHTPFTLLYTNATNYVLPVTIGSNLSFSTGGTLSVTGLTSEPTTNIQASTTSLTPNITLYSEEVITTLSTGLTINAPTGTPVNGQTFIIRIKDDGTVRTLTWDSIYRFSLNNQAPANTTINKTAYFYCKYNSTDTKWDVMWVNNF